LALCDAWADEDLQPQGTQRTLDLPEHEHKHLRRAAY
jgi:hypothetical protein